MKKIVSCLLVCVMVFSCCASAFAVSAEPYASLTITSGIASMTPGKNSGEIRINYQTGASKTSSPIGVASIVIYKSDGTYVTTIKGSTANGLMANRALSKNGSYTYRGVSGTSYYAIVSITATAGSEYDSRNVITNIAKAK